MPNNADLAAARAASAGKRKKGRGRRISKAQKAAEEAAAEETAEEAEEAAEAEAAEARRASSRHARKARTDGSVAEVKPSRADKVACAEAEPVPTVMEVALQEMRAFKRGWACALWVWGRLHVYLAGDLENDRRWIKKVVTGAEESEQVPVDKDRLESQHMVVMKQQKFFFVDTAGFEPFDDVRGKGEGKGNRVGSKAGLWVYKPGKAASRK